MYTKEIVVLKGLKNGYLQFRDNTHPLKYESDNSVYLHRHIASIKVNRWLSSEEHVHHIDGNRLNNKPENLQVLTQQEHQLIHSKPSKFFTSDNRFIEEFQCETCKMWFNPFKNSKGRFCSDTCYKTTLVKNKEITKEILDELIPNTSWTALGKMFGYSDNVIKKRAKALGCNISKGKFAHK